MPVVRAAQVIAYGQPIELVEVPEPAISDPHDVLVRIAGAGICRTDLHILGGELAAAFGPRLPYTLGHENAGWVHEVGPAVSHLAPGDPVIVHPAVTCGVCSPCRAGVDMHCPSWRFPGVDGWDGGYGELLRTSARALVKLPAGGLGHLAIQLLRIYTPARIVVLDNDPGREAFARSFGPDAVHMTGADGGVGSVLEETGGHGADAVLDLVGEHGVPVAAMRMLRKGGVYSIVGYG